MPGVAEAEWVALFSVDGSLLRQSSSMWEGFADVQVRVQSFRKSKSDWVSADSFTTKRQRLPLRRWSDNSAVHADQFAKAAKKLVNKWSRTQIKNTLLRVRN